MTVRVAVTAPVAVGANSTSTRQLEPVASVTPQLFTWAKDAAPAPLSTKEVRFRGVVVLVLVMVTDCATLLVLCVTEPKLRVVEESTIVGAATPVPLSDTVWVAEEALEALSEKISVADWAPETAGAKRSRAVQLADAASELGQLFIWLKDLGLEPPRAMEEMASGALPVLVRVMTCAGL